MPPTELQLDKDSSGKYRILIQGQACDDLSGFDCPRKAVAKALKIYSNIVITIPVALSQDFSESQSRIIFDPHDVDIRIDYTPPPKAA